MALTGVCVTAFCITRYCGFDANSFSKSASCSAVRFRSIALDGITAAKPAPPLPGWRLRALSTTRHPHRFSSRRDAAPDRSASVDQAALVRLDQAARDAEFAAVDGDRDQVDRGRLPLGPPTACVGPRHLALRDSH